MKQKDLALVMVIVFMSAVFSLVISRFLISSKTGNQEVEVVQKISSSFTQPDKRFFNKDAYDPTQLITIQQNSNSAPFSATAQP